MTFKDIISPSWLPLFEEIDSKIFKETEDLYLKEKNNKNKIIFPEHENIFSFTKYCLFEDVKVVIIGQDCYHGEYYNEYKYKPQATGLAFSVPINCKIPPSLNNIYINLLKYKNIYKKPKSGNLEFWAYQGVILLNTSLTVEKSKPNSHQHIWNKFTDELIKTISRKKDNIIFVLWGTNAYSKYKIIYNREYPIIIHASADKIKHRFIISSHPSPLSAYNKLGCYDSFMETNTFSLINKYLEENKQNKILWQIN
jgi:uracil-DNA glycosylase